MPRQYRKVVFERQSHRYSSDNLQSALDVCRTGTMSINKAAKHFQIPKGTLINRLHGKFQKIQGRPTALTVAEEECIVERLILCAQWGFPLIRQDIRLIIKSYLDNSAKVVSIFKDNMPGVDWFVSFMSRHKDKLSERTANYIKRTRAAVSANTLKEYHDEITKELGLPPSNIFNYDETNLSDTPGKMKAVFPKGVKYPDQALAHTRSAISLMFCVAADGTLLPPMVVYKALNMYRGWMSNGPKGSPCCADV